MKHYMAKLQPLYLRYSRQNFACALHNNSVFVKVQVAVHVGHIAYHAFFIYNNGTSEYYPVVFHKRKLLMRPELILEITVSGVSADWGVKYGLFNLLSRISCIAAYLHLRNPQRYHGNSYDRQHGQSCNQACFSSVSDICPHICTSCRNCFMPLIPDTRAFLPDCLNRGRYPRIP